MVALGSSITKDYGGCYGKPSKDIEVLPMVSLRHCNMQYGVGFSFVDFQGWNKIRRLATPCRGAH